MSNRLVRARANTYLTEDQLRSSVPALFAEAPHESRSDRYRFIPTVDVMHALVKAGFQPVEARQSTTRDEGKRNYTKHMIRFRAATTDLAVGDTFFETILRNGHDGSAAYEMSAGLFRLLCLNGMATKSADWGEVKVRHSGNPDNIIREVVDGARTVLEHGPKVLAAVKQWQEIELTPDEMGVYSDAAHRLRFEDADGKINTPITAPQLLTPRRSADTRNDLWTVYNRVQENAIRGGLSAIGHNADGRPRRSTTRGINGIDQDMKLNRALWQITEHFAKQKQDETGA